MLWVFLVFGAAIHCLLLWAILLMAKTDPLV